MKFSSLLKTSGLFVAVLSFVQCSSSSTPATNKPVDSGTDSAECQDYCTTIMANCTGGDQSAATSNQQYNAMANCLAVCKIFPVGSPSDTSKNTLGCRNYHAHLAGGDASNAAATHCPHAGPSGDGVCGDVCTGYCQIVDAFCVGPAKIYSSDADCMTTCNATPGDMRFNVAIQTGDEKACLVYHAQESPISAQTALDHCVGDLSKKADAGTTEGSVTCQ